MTGDGSSTNDRFSCQTGDQTLERAADSRGIVTSNPPFSPLPPGRFAGGPKSKAEKFDGAPVRI
jgi:hypothetical protein